MARHDDARLHGDRRGAWRALVLPCVLVSVLAAAQAVAITHDLEPGGHPAGDVCALCISISTLGAGNAAACSAALAPTAHEIAAAAGPNALPAALAATYHARAPPAAS